MNHDELRTAILSVDDLPHEPVEVPEWGVTVYVRRMSGEQLDQHDELRMAAYKAVKDDERVFVPQFRARLVAFTACDQDGNPLFTPDDIEALNAKSGRALDRLYEAAMRVNHLRDEDVEELEKNSDAGRSEDS